MKFYLFFFFCTNVCGCVLFENSRRVPFFLISANKSLRRSLLFLCNENEKNSFSIFTGRLLLWAHNVHKLHLSHGILHIFLFFPLLLLMRITSSITHSIHLFFLFLFFRLAFLLTRINYFFDITFVFIPYDGILLF